MPHVSQRIGLLLILAGLALAATATGCVRKDPVRAPWLLPGFYPDSAPRAPRVEGPASPLAVQPAAAEAWADLAIELPGIGAVTARVHVAGSAGRVYVAETAASPVRVLDPEAGRAAAPGFLLGVDLRLRTPCHARIRPSSRAARRRAAR